MTQNANVKTVLNQISDNIEQLTDVSYKYGQIASSYHSSDSYRFIANIMLESCSNLMLNYIKRYDRIIKLMKQQQ